MRILVVDDHPLMCDAVAGILRMSTPSVEVFTMASLRETLAFLTSRADNEIVNLILLDLNLGDSSRLEALQTIKLNYADIPIVVMSAEREPKTIIESLTQGAVGYIPKTSTGEVLVHALQLVASGNIYIPPEALAYVTGRQTSLEAAHDSSQDKGAARKRMIGNPPTTPSQNHDLLMQLGLTDRQIDVLRLILRGLPNKSICRQLELAEGTVKVHVSAVLRALNSTSRTQAVIAAGALGLRFD